MENFPILLILICLPIVSALFIMAFVKHSRNPRKIFYSKYVTMLSSVLTFVCSIFLLLDFDIKPGYQFIENYSLIESMDLTISFAVDGISIFFIFLTTLLTLISLIISMFSISKNVKEFLVLFLLLEGLSIGVFSTTNLLLFYIFFEAILIPMYFIIGIWGGENRVYAAFKFFLYTLVGSVLFLIVIIFMHTKFGTLSMLELAEKAPSLDYNTQIILWLAAFAAFAVKVPMTPFHTWLPDAHVQAPTSGSVILAGILLKVGAYGFIRISLPMMPLASVLFAPFVVALSVFAIIYASFVAIAQTDMKKMIAYSSVAHMGYVTAGIFSMNEEGVNGAIFQMISHGLVSSALFMVVGVLYERLGTKEISKYGGVAAKMPKLAFYFMILTLASVGLPGTSGFIGEFYSLAGIFKFNIYLGALAAFGVVYGAIYMLRLYRSVMLGNITNIEVEKFSDLSAREIICFMPLIFLSILIGVFPSIVTSYFAGDVHNIIAKIGSIQ
jgi:NADH-quinone oxidoreductase subunit M